MFLHREDLEKILEILKKFPEVDVVEVEQDSSSGIGSHTTIKIDTNINGVNGRFETVISSVENW